MTILQAIINVANEAGYTVDNEAIGSDDVTTKQLLAMAQRIIKEMADAYAWPKLYASGSVTLADGVASYALPSAFSYYHYETFWNQSTRWRVLGPMSPQQYAEILGFGVVPTVYQQFQIRGLSNNELLISPTPTATQAGQTLIFEYICARPVRPATWAASTLYAANSYTFYNGNYYTTTAGGTSGATPPTHTSGSASDGGVTWDYYSGPYEQFLADTDEPNLSQRVLEQGMLERFAQVHGLDSVVPRFGVQLDEEFSKQLPGKILYAGGVTRDRFQFGRSDVVTFGTGWI